jgi:glucose/arabinose dehydrogenase
VPHLAAAFLILLLLVAPAGAHAQAGVSYEVPGDNPFAAQPGAAPEVYALGLRNPYRFSFDRLTGDVLIGDVGGSQREEIDWVTAAGARGANFGWACREGKLAGPRTDECPVPGAIEPLFDYPTSSPDAVTGGFVVRDPSLTGLEGRYLYADYFTGLIRSLALDFSDPDDQSTGLTVATLASFGEDASGRLYAASNSGDTVVRLVAGGSPGTLDADPLTGPFDSPVAIGTHPGDAARLFVAELGGKVRLVVDDAVRATPFLDVAPFGLSNGGERGLLSVVAAPDYVASGKVYVYYTESGGDIRIDEFTRSAANPEIADPASRRNVLTIEHSSEGNHNGGQLQFGRDGCLWVTTGDGGGQNNEHDNSQNLGTLLGKILRIDPNAPGVGGPECAGGAAQNPPPTPIVTPDTTPPALRTRVPRRQRVLRLRGAIAYARCSEACRIEAGGTLVTRGRRVLLRRAVAPAAANQRVRLRVRLRPRARRLLGRALARGGRPRAVLRLRAADAAGNRSTLVRHTLRVRR